MKRIILAVAIAGVLAVGVPAEAYPVDGTARFYVHLTVTTPHGYQTVRVHWRVTCWSGGASAGRRGHFRGITPFETTLPTPMRIADRCWAAAWVRNLTGPATPHVDVEVTQRAARLI